MGSEHLPDWVRVFRTGFAPQLSTAGLVALREALERDSPALVQDDTVRPRPWQDNLDKPVTGACAVAFCVWQGEPLLTVGEVEERFAEVMDQCDKLVGEFTAGRHFLNAFDGWERGDMRRLLLPEVESVLATRLAVAAG